MFLNAGSSFGNMFPEHLRQRSQRGEVGEGVVGALAREAPDAAGGSQGSSQPLRLSDMLKRVSSQQKVLNYTLIQRF